MSAQERFAACLPRMRAVLEFRLRGIYSADEREELLAEGIALCWKRWVKLESCGKIPGSWPTALARRVSQEVARGRRLCGKSPCRDIWTTRAPSAEGHSVPKISRFPRHKVRQLAPLSNELLAVLSDAKQGDPGELARFRLDFQDWLQALPRGHQLVLEGFGLGWTARQIAGATGFSVHWVYELRRLLLQRWNSSQAD